MTQHQVNNENRAPVSTEAKTPPAASSNEAIKTKLPEIVDFKALEQNSPLNEIDFPPKSKPPTSDEKEQPTSPSTTKKKTEKISLDVIKPPPYHPLESTSYSRLESCARKRFLRMWGSPKPTQDEEISPRRTKARLIAGLDSGESMAGKAVHEAIAYCLKALRGSRTDDGRVTKAPRIVPLNELLDYAERKMRGMINYSEEKAPELIKNPWTKTEQTQAILKHDIERLLGDTIPEDRRLKDERITAIRKGWDRLYEAIGNWYQHWFLPTNLPQLPGHTPFSKLKPDQILEVEGERANRSAIVSGEISRWGSLKNFFWDVPISRKALDPTVRGKIFQVKHLLVVDLITVHPTDRTEEWYDDIDKMLTCLNVHDWKTDRIEQSEDIPKYTRTAHGEQRTQYIHYTNSDKTYSDYPPERIWTTWTYINGEVNSVAKRTDRHLARDLLPLMDRVDAQILKLLSQDVGRFENLLKGITREELWPKTEDPADCNFCNYRWVNVCGGHDTDP